MDEKNVLIVEKSNSERQALIQHLCITDSDIIIDGVADFHEAINAIKMLEGDSGYDVIITDLGMLPQEGFSFIKGINERYPTIPIIIISERSIINKFQDVLLACEIFEIHCKPILMEYFQLTLNIAIKHSRKST